MIVKKVRYWAYIVMLGKHMKVGAGYNFTDFSDDLTDNDYDSNGWFFDITGKY